MIKLFVNMFLTTPILDKEKVPPVMSFREIDDFLPSSWSLFNSLAISIILRFWTFLIFGTTNPSGVSMARLILCSSKTCNVCELSSTHAFNRGNSLSAFDTAFMKKGIKVKEMPFSFRKFFTSFLNCTSLVTSHSSLYTKCGILWKTM